MQTIGGIYTFSRKKRTISADKVRTRFEKRSRIPPFIDCGKALKYEIGKSNKPLNIDCIKRLRFSR